MRHSVTAAMKNRIVETASKLPASFSLANFRIIEGHDVALVTLATSASSDRTTEDLKESFAKRFDNQAVLIDQSFNVLASYNGKKFISALARQNVVSKEYDVSGMACIAADTFLDEGENSIWKSIGQGESRRLVLQSSDDFEKLLSSRRQIMTSPELALASTLANGQYVMFYSPIEDEMRFGYSFIDKAGLNVVRRDNEQVEQVDAGLVVEVASQLEEPYQVVFNNREAVTALDSQAVKDLVAYYKKLYKGTSFFMKLEKIIRNARA